MDHRLALLAARAADHHRVFTRADARSAGVSDDWRFRLLERAALTRLGANSFCFAGTPTTWHSQLVAGLADLGPEAVIAGRPAGALLQLDGFTPGGVEFLVPRTQRRRCSAGTVHSTGRPMRPADRVMVDDLAVISASRLIIEGARFRLSKLELENATDSAIRLGWTSAAYLQRQFAEMRGSGLRGARMLDQVLGISGVESKLERDFLRLIRRAGFREPDVQVVHRDGGRTIARVDFRFDSVIIEVAGHGTHATRRQRQRDAQRHTELTLAGLTVLTFTYEDLHERPTWVLEQVRRALQLAA
jgi:very-short-patch-repair endonuclease